MEYSRSTESFLITGTLIIIQLQCIFFLVHGIKPDVQNKQSSILDHIEGLPKVQAVQLCPKECRCESRIGEFKVTCSDRSLIEVPAGIPLHVTALNLSKNNLTELNSKNIDELSKLEKLIMSNNLITSVTSDSLDGLLNLIILDLSFNKIAFMPSRSLHKLKKLQVLNLSNNKLSVISAGFLFSLSSLSTLKLSHNSLVGLDKDQFVYQQQLRHLDLSANRLREIKHDWFQTLTELRMLNMSHNRFSAIINLMFVNMVNLEKLDLNSNNVSSLGTVSFKGLVNLKYLDLKRNFIARLPDKVFSLMTNLEDLDLSYNPFMSLKNSFHKNFKLRNLRLNNLTKIERITGGSFDSLINLEDLSISGNSHLQEISVDALNPLTNCKYLNLTHNRLETLPRHFLDGLKKLRSISLYGNPWICDCRLFWLFAWLRSLPIPPPNFNRHQQMFCAQPLNFSRTSVLDALDKIPCRNATITKTTKNSQFKVGASALLECISSGFPRPNVTWTTPDRSLYHVNNTVNKSNEFNAKSFQNENTPRVFVLGNGNLFIRKLLRNDGGYYFCTVNNVLNNVTKPVHLMLDYKFMNHIKIVSLLVGLALSVSFLLVSMFILLIITIARRLGWHCCCSKGSVSPKTKQIRKMLEYMEQYKEHQLEKLRDNYTQQTQKIRDNCSQQMERLRESYSLQFERIQNICDYGNQQIDKVRDNYTQQVQRVRDYSAGQLDKLRDNYLYQRNRIRKFSAHHLYKLRENYKLQQQHLNKIIENLNIDSCRTVCARTESIIFEPELTMETVFRAQIPGLTDPLDGFTCQKDQGDTLSQNSAYFTPNDSMSRAESPGPQVDLHTESKLAVDSEEISDSAISTQETNIVLENTAAGGSLNEVKTDSMDDVASIKNDVDSNSQDSHYVVPDDQNSVKLEVNV